MENTHDPNQNLSQVGGQQPPSQQPPVPQVPYPENTQPTSAGQGMGIAGLVLGVLALIVAFIPCVGVLALVPGAIAVILSFIALHQANQGNGAKGLIIAALVISIVATCVAAFWGIVIGGASRDSHRWLDRIERFVDIAEERSDREIARSARRGEGSTANALAELGEELEKTLQIREDQLRAVEQLLADEKDPDFEDRYGDTLTDAEFEELLKDYDKTVGELTSLSAELEQGEISALAAYPAMALRAARLGLIFARVGANLTEEQQKRIEEVNKRHEKAMEAFDD